VHEAIDQVGHLFIASFDAWGSSPDRWVACWAFGVLAGGLFEELGFRARWVLSGESFAADAVSIWAAAWFVAELKIFWCVRSGLTILGYGRLFIVFVVIKIEDGLGLFVVVSEGLVSELVGPLVL
jgi:hypothetical protein